MKNNNQEAYGAEQASAAPRGITRRRAVAAAAWSVPLIAAAVAAPASAASATTTIAFALPAYAGTGCAAVDNMRITVTPTVANAIVTVSLTGGYTFAGGATSLTVTTDASGAATVPACSAPAVGDSGTAVATYNGASAQAVLASAVAITIGRSVTSTALVSTEAWPNIPMGSTPLGGGFFLAGSDLYNGNALRASGVTAAFGYSGDASPDWADYLDASGTAHTVRHDGERHYTWPSVPAWSTPIGARYFLDPATNVLHREAKIVWPNVATAVGYTGTDGYNTADFVELIGENTTGVTKIATRNIVVRDTPDMVPDGATPLGGGFFLSGEDLYCDWGGHASEDVWAAFGYAGSDNSLSYASVIKTDGSAHRIDQYGRAEAWTEVPLWATPLSANYFLAGTDLYYGNTLTARSVAAAYGYPASHTSDASSPENVDYVSFTTQITAC